MALSFSLLSIGQDNFSTTILEKIISNNSSFNTLTEFQNRNGSYVEDSVTGQITLHLDENIKALENKGSYILIDTFNFFGQGIFQKSNEFVIEVRKKLIIENLRSRKDIYMVNGIGMDKNLFWVGIFHPFSNSIASYAFSISNSIIKLEKVKMGVY